MGSTAAAQSSFRLGADLSFLTEVEAQGGVFFEDGQAVEPAELFRANGVSLARLRVWHSPAGGINGFEETLRSAKRLHAAGFDLLIDLHYSDTWADPGQQAKPVAWEGLDFETLRDSVYAYSRQITEALQAQGTPPAIVQLGNEITTGLLWPEGRVGDTFDTPAQWRNLAGLLDAGAQGVREAVPNAQLMIHIDRGGDASGAQWFFDRLLEEDLDFDLIGLSFYPWWHGRLSDLESTLRILGDRYEKDLLLAEVAYPWTLAWADNTHNPVGEARHLHPGYDATPEGQRAFLEDVIALVQAVPDGRGAGVVYWAPDWITTPGLGSSWENLALFDFAGEALPALDAFANASPVSTSSPPAHKGLTFHLAPNPTAGSGRFHIDLDTSGPVRLVIFDALGRPVATVLDESRAAGVIVLPFDVSGLPAGVYVARLSTPTGDRTAPFVVAR